MVVETSVELEGNQTPTVCSISYIRVWAYIGTFSLSLYVRSRRFSGIRFCDLSLKVMGDQLITQIKRIYFFARCSLTLVV